MTKDLPKKKSAKSDIPGISKKWRDIFHLFRSWVIASTVSVSSSSDWSEAVAWAPVVPVVGASN